MTFPSYQEFLEEIVCQLKDKIKGKIELRRYDIEVRFNYNLIICVSCDFGREIHKLYCSYKHEPELAEYIVHVGTMQVFDFIKRSIFDYFFQIP